MRASVQHATETAETGKRKSEGVDSVPRHSLIRTPTLTANTRAPRKAHHERRFSRATHPPYPQWRRPSKQASKQVDRRGVCYVARSATSASGGCLALATIRTCMLQANRQASERSTESLSTSESTYICTSVPGVSLSKSMKILSSCVPSNISESEFTFIVALVVRKMSQSAFHS